MPKPFDWARVIIAIPSYGRAHHFGASRFCTAQYLTRPAWLRTTYYVEREEYKQYKEVVTPNGGKVVTTSRAATQKKWGSIMDLIIDECAPQCDKLIIMDDDLALAVRPNLPSKPTTFVPMDEVYFNSMVRELCALATATTPLVSTQYRQFCQGKFDTYQHNQRISMIWAMDAKFFKANQQFRFYRGSNLDFMSDYHFFLNLLLHGYPNLCINKYTKDDQPNREGGESAKRKLPVFNKAVRQFAAMYPSYVRVRTKQDKGHWADGMLGVTIQAAKAYRDSVKALQAV